MASYTLGRSVRYFREEKYRDRDALDVRKIIILILHFLRAKLEHYFY